jgi:hypothetical protein
MTPNEVERLARQLKELSESLAKEEPPSLSTARAKYVRKAITEAYDKLQHVIEKLDPIKSPGSIFDPANPNVVGRIIGITMIAQPRKPLANVNVERFYGSGVYAIYYNGNYSGYAAISKREHPIYVGKADPTNSAAKTAIDQGDRLSNRLNDHRKNIAKAKTTLRLEDFEYRALVVQTGWQAAAEGYLIHLFKPIWNKEIGICYGFGKHGDSPTTRANLRSPWDTLHSGREWAHRNPQMSDAKPSKKILKEIAEHLAANPPLKSIDEILRRFLEEIRSVS